MTTLDADDIKRLKPKPWMIELLKCNPSYNGWGPHQDAMCGDDATDFDSWEDFISEYGDADEDYNVCINFYFEVEVPSEDCSHCEGGYTPKALSIMNNLGYDIDRYQKDVVEFLKKRYPGQDFKGPFGIASNEKHFAAKYICERDNIEFICPHCDGDGSIDTGDSYVKLNIWMAYPRKGRSIGIAIKNVSEDDVPDVYDYLNKARMYNAGLFKGIDSLKEKSRVGKKSKS
jgi:hypothetical protein